VWLTITENVSRIRESFFVPAARKTEAAGAAARFLLR